MMCTACIRFGEKPCSEELLLYIYLAGAHCEQPGGVTGGGQDTQAAPG
jgi:hypothetical protein